MTKIGFEWNPARTMAHLFFDGKFTGISTSLTKCRPSDELLAKMNLPPLPKKGG